MLNEIDLLVVRGMRKEILEADLKGRQPEGYELAKAINAGFMT